jgi:hypothetical protein
MSRSPVVHEPHHSANVSWHILQQFWQWLLQKDNIIRRRKDAICMPNKARIQTLLIFNTYCFSTATMVTRTRLHVTLSKFCDCFLCSQTCVVVRCFEGGLLWGRSLLKPFCKVLRVWVYRSELMVWPCGMLSTKITPSASQKPVAMTFPSEGIALNYFFRGEDSLCHSTDCFLVCGSKWWIHVSSPMTICDKKLSPSAS